MRHHALDRRKFNGGASRDRVGRCHEYLYILKRKNLTPKQYDALVEPFVGLGVEIPPHPTGNPAPETTGRATCDPSPTATARPTAPVPTTATSAGSRMAPVHGSSPLRGPCRHLLMMAGATEGGRGLGGQRCGLLHRGAGGDTGDTRSAR
ncbi:hypothetical protein GCM10010207_53050 [Streptomyces atratus]|nr:hypothetical protein GCM10010207_53050 [Streptomyces atratus]